MSSFDIFDVADAFGMEILEHNADRKRNPDRDPMGAKAQGASYSQVFAVCPFCGDERGKFSMTKKSSGDSSGAYHCFVCDAHGNAFSLCESLATEDFGNGPDKYKNIAKYMYKAMGLDNPQESKIRKIEPKPSKPKIIEAEKKSAEHCSKVYYAMLSRLTLLPGHRANLISRGFDDESIKKFRFKSTPSNGREICRQLISAGYDLEGVPGFYMRKGVWEMAISSPGYFVPVFQRNLITGFQIRADKPKNGAKYVWFSSKEKEKGCPSGSPCTYLPGKNEETVVVTEGVLKSIAAYTLLNGQVTIIGIPGIKVLHGLFDVLPDNDFYAFEAYDMEKIPNQKILEMKEAAKQEGLTEITARDRKYHELFKQQNVERAAEKLSEMLKVKNGLDAHSLSWDVKDGVWNGKYKGIDDFLYAMGTNMKQKFVDYLKRLTLENLKKTA